ncbi:MAG TPA: DUF6502 family protein [Burkholderiaceae bacterium]
MLTNTALHAALKSAVARLLRPLVRLLVRHAFPYDAFAAIAKRVYVDVAMEDFALDDRKPTISRASILTGLTRKEVSSLLERRPAGEPGEETVEHNNRAARVLSAWGREREFTTEAGEPRPLPLEGDDGFAGLVRRHSGDMPVRAMLDELLRLGAVTVDDCGIARLRQRAFVPQASVVRKLAILGSDVGDLIATIDHNIERGQVDARFQRKVMYDLVPLHALPAFRALGAERAQQLLEILDGWLSRRDLDHLDAVDADRTQPTARVGLGIYYFEEANGRAPLATGGPP